MGVMIRLRVWIRGCRSCASPPASYCNTHTLTHTHTHSHTVDRPGLTPRENGLMAHSKKEVKRWVRRRVGRQSDLEREVRRDLLSRHSASLTREALARPPLLLNRSTDNRTERVQKIVLGCWLDLRVLLLVGCSQIRGCIRCSPDALACCQSLEAHGGGHSTVAVSLGRVLFLFGCPRRFLNSINLETTNHTHSAGRILWCNEAQAFLSIMQQGTGHA
jgi:hypothetical protein